MFDEDERQVILIVYVDDLIIASRSYNELMKIKKSLQHTFKMIDLGPISHILGMDIKRESPTGKLCLSQIKYIKYLINKFNFNDAKETVTPLDANIKISKDLGSQTDEEHIEINRKPYRELIGGLIYLANATRPDIASAAN